LRPLSLSLQAKQQPKSYALDARQMDGILQLAQASTRPSAAAAPAAAPAPASKLHFEQLRTTLWDTIAKKRVPATSYQGDMQAYLAKNPHLEVYNRQDRQRATGQTLMAGMRVPTYAPTAVGTSPDDLKVVVWHTQEQRKLRAEEAPTQGELCRFLQANPLIVIWEGQTTPPPPSSMPEPPLYTKPALPLKPTARLKPANIPIAKAVVTSIPTAATAGELLRLASHAQLKSQPTTPVTPSSKPSKKGGVRWKNVMTLGGVVSAGVPMGAR
jgi:hypothetical protein